MTVEEALVWPALRAAAWKAYRMFKKLPGCYLETEDFLMVGLLAVALRIEENPDTDRPLLRTIAYRRMIDYGRSRSDVPRKNAFVEGFRGLREVLSIDAAVNVPAPDHANSDELDPRALEEIAGWVQVGRFGLDWKEVEVLRMLHWKGITPWKMKQYIFYDKGSEPAVLIERAHAKIRNGLQEADVAFLKDMAPYHRQLRARSAECR